MLRYARNQKIHIAERRGGPWGKKMLRKLERKAEILEGKVDELSKKIEAQEKEKKIEKIVSLSAELLTILAGLIAIAQFLS